MVQQEPVIFSGTVADNISYGDLGATPTQIMTATSQAELHDFIMTLPTKYETEVGRNGIALSGGQKQRLALSTALLTQPEVLLLDDTTSALDAETEMRIRSTLDKVLEGRTSIIITQRIATARGCDRILVFEDGRLTQEGTHDELKVTDGFYKRIYEQQESI
jgi:ABC-type multidrug transport system fused ATPase/permease subunit